jgi:hypothetical protein
VINKTAFYSKEAATRRREKIGCYQRNRTPKRLGKGPTNFLSNIKTVFYFKVAATRKIKNIL